MQNKMFWLSLVILPFLLNSCSSQEEKNLNSEEEKVSLYFGPVFLEKIPEQALKQEQERDCSDLIPAFADVVLSQEGRYVAGTMTEPLRIEFSDLVSGDGEFFTVETPSLQLAPGIYFLEYFSILDSEGEIIWIAPHSKGTGGASHEVNNPLPIEIVILQDGQQFADVEVVCFDSENRDSYGNFSTALRTTQIIEFCIFGDLCDENGRHEEAIQYSVSVWKYSGDAGNPKGGNLYKNELSPLIITDYEDYSETNARPLCLKLPDSEEEDRYYIEIFLDDEIIRSGVITDSQVRGLYDGEDRMDPYHFREGNCNLGDTPEFF